MKAPNFLKFARNRRWFFGSILILCVTGIIYFSINNEGNFAKTLLDNFLPPNLSSFILIAVPTSISILIIGVSNEIFGADLRDWFEGKEDQEGISVKHIEADVKKFYDSLKTGLLEERTIFFINKIRPSKPLKGRYQERYESKLDGRFEITLEVSDDFDSPNPRSITEQFGENATIGTAIEVIREVFEKKGRLLIVGNPGVGKTVLLLKLAIGLLDKIEDPEKEPFPIIFNLASWSGEYEKFGDWLKGMLVSGYGLSYVFAKQLLDQNRIILLLDGFDELARNETDEISSEKRANCLDSLNNYLYLHNGCKVVICSRINEFLKMKKKQKQDAPVSAKVRVLNLSPGKVLEALKRAKDDQDFKHQTSARNLLELFEKGKNKNLLEILRTPFYFTTAVEVFDQPLLKEKNILGNSTEIERFLKDKFIEKKLDHEVTENLDNFKPEKTKKWLKWLAKLMEKKQIVTFELADLQPTDLIKQLHFNLLFGLGGSLVGGLFFAQFYGLFYGLFICLAGGLFYGMLRSRVNNLFQGKLFGLFRCLVVGIVVGICFLLDGGWYYGLFYGFFGGMSIGLFGRLFHSMATGFFSDRISTEDLIHLNFRRFLTWYYWKGILYCFAPGGYVFFVVSVDAGWLAGLIGGGFYGLVFVLFMGLMNLKEIKSVTYLKNPYQRISGGFLVNFLFACTVVPLLIIGFIFLSYIEINDLTKHLKTGIFLIILFSLSQILKMTLFRHSVLRLALFFEGSTPLKYAAFLDYTAAARILEKDGGQWRFRHQTLQEYFAKLGE